MFTELETKVLESLRNGHDENYGDREGWKLLYLDNEINLSDKSVVGALGSLTKKGYYEEEDGFAFGWIRI